MAFDKIPQAVLDGQADLGLLIHEGQITHAAMGLTKVLDLGESWARETGLPLPLGINVMRRDLGEDLHRALSQGLRDAIAWAHGNVDEALDYAMRYGRGIDKETCRRFVLMYVNDYTVTLGDEGRRALHFKTGAQTDPPGKWKSSRAPFEKCGRKDSDDFGSKNTFGWFAPLSTAGQPSSVSQIGLLCGTQPVGVPTSTPPGRL